MRFKMLQITASFILVLLTFSCGKHVLDDPRALKSFDTGYTIMKVRSAKLNKRFAVVASTYEGSVIAMDTEGVVLWKNKLSGTMNHDLWCQDITGDGQDETFAANADGHLYCLGEDGKLLWEFSPNSAPMYSVSVIHKNNEPYVVCGGFDKSIYYLNKKGRMIKEISSYSYSQENPWQPYSKAIPDSGCHTANYIRTIQQKDGSEVLAVHGVIHSMAIVARGSVYFFKPLADKPYKTIKLKNGRPLGEMRVAAVGSANEELLMGSSTMIHDASMLRVDPKTDAQTVFSIKNIHNGIDNFGYRVVQPEVINDGGKKKFMLLFGARILLLPLDMDTTQAEVLKNSYAYNDMWKDPVSGQIILASTQSGGSCIHLLNPLNKAWKAAYQNLEPKGKIASIWRNTNRLKKHLETFRAPVWERSPLPVYFMSDHIPQSKKTLGDSIKKYCSSPVFLGSTGTKRAEKYDRSSIKNERYRKRRDGRRIYDASSKEMEDFFASKYANNDVGMAYWGGHGNDPYMIQRKTLERVLDRANGKKTVLIYPELEDHSSNFSYVMKDYFYPLAAHCRKTNGMIYVRTKHSFWQANVYLPMWSRLLSGEFSDVFIPSMEETTDKSMELSIAARLGIWASGATDSWGSRCARDNPSFDRMRQHSHQMLPNHFLRMMVYHISSGAQYLDNFPVNQEYMSILWELIAKGALYVPKRNEMVSFSPVHLSMLLPDEHYLESSSNVKWTTFYNAEFEKDHPFVFSRLNGSWPGAPVTAWDFSRYAAGVNDRRLNFLAPYKNGLVLFTPPQNGKFADPSAPRGPLRDHLHPIYRNILKEYYTDGRRYYSADGKESYAADTYYTKIAKDIEQSAELLPLTVDGGVAWVAAQTAPKHIRLTIIDGGYLNPNRRMATVTFHTAKPVRIMDVLSKEKFQLNAKKTVKIDIPCGMFRFIDVELSKPLAQ